MGNSSRVNGSQGSECRWLVDKFYKPLIFRPPRVVMRARVKDLLCSLFGQPSQLVGTIAITMAATNNTPTQLDKDQVFIAFLRLYIFLRLLMILQIFGMAEKEMEYRVEMFNKKIKPSRYKEAELNMGENSCIDRCVSKYWQLEACMLRTDVHFPSGLGDQSHWAIARFQSASNVNFVHAHPISKQLPWETWRFCLPVSFVPCLHFLSGW
ncbi:hypothetical protein RHGRI_036281 [Rhododendron griersonianum]|uniref:Tim10-like domain-containing protein n=1 Tax=Rhododendron griersonianum TaxID=479676 RepID=A0AAV6HST5_9ERIC|nr:hypothetical protein RHGRI_036281 [Rhododendron griersonianum]